MRTPPPDFDRDLADPTRVFQAKGARHGLAAAEIDALLARQGGRCAICRRDTPGALPNWALDHDHRHHPGKEGCRLCVRGLLCDDCNVLLGRAHDDPQVLFAAADYLQRAERSRRFA